MCTRQLMYENNTHEDNTARLMDDTITLSGVILQISLFVSITHTVHESIVLDFHEGILYSISLKQSMYNHCFKGILVIISTVHIPTLLHLESLIGMNIFHCVSSMEKVHYL